ncbi:MAG: hypothetical protein D6741_14095 [Planctomycetota bacterium]|nr:MAG: hypothetical protein D6741_14095 [Planctomycetota bacterium]
MAVFGIVASAAVDAGLAQTPVSTAVEHILAAGPNGVGQREAARAAQTLATAGPSIVPELLAAMRRANPIARNFLRNAVEVAIENGKNRNEGLPVAALQQFVLDREQLPQARRFAYELLLPETPDWCDRVLADMLDDPSLELRRDAVAQLVASVPKEVNANTRDEAIAKLQRAFEAARDRDQVRAIATRLRELGVAADVNRHDGFVLSWWLTGPFDNTDRAGFARVYPPETKAFPDLSATYPGKHGTVGWKPWRVPQGQTAVDLNTALVEEKEVVGYALACVVSPRAQTVSIRFSTVNAVALWVNGKKYAGFEIYHSGVQPDQYVVDVPLRKGKNSVLVKLCQNEQTQSWARPWEFSLRICDALGGGGVVEVVDATQVAPEQVWK